MIEELSEKDFNKIRHLFKEKPFIEGLRSTLDGIPDSYTIVPDAHSKDRVLYLGYYQTL